MKNAFGVELDKNGYAPSIMQSDIERCYLCGRSDRKLDRHEPFNGVANRQKSKELGMWVTLCHHPCHLDNVHKYAQEAFKLKREAQLSAMRKYGWDTKRFIIEFGKNWL